MTHDAIVARKGQLQAVTGLSEAAFAHLHTVFAAVVEQARRHYTLQGTVRQRALRALPRDSAFAATEDLLLFVLSYLKSNPLQAAHAASFGLTQPQANAWLHRSLPWLRDALARLGELPARPDQALPAVLARACCSMPPSGPCRAAPTPRRSGRITRVKKRHTVKNNLICCPGKRVLFLSATYPGSVHDKAICDEEAYTFPEGIVLDQDAGYQGHQPAGVQVRQPVKKPRGKERTAEQKAQNQAHSRQRVVIEHAIGLCKRWRVVRDVFRGRVEEMRDTVMLLCCGLHNLLLPKNNA